MSSPIYCGHSDPGPAHELPSLFKGPRTAGREHIPIYPRIYRIGRGVVIPVSTIIFVLVAITFTDHLPLGLLFSTSFASLITSGYFVVAYYHAPAIFNYWALLGLDALNVVTWNVSAAYLVYRMLSSDWWHDSDYMPIKVRCTLVTALCAGICLIALSFHRAAGFPCVHRPCVRRADLEKQDHTTDSSVSTPTALNQYETAVLNWLKTQSSTVNLPDGGGYCELLGSTEMSKELDDTPVSYTKSPVDPCAHNTLLASTDKVMEPDLTPVSDIESPVDPCAYNILVPRQQTPDCHEVAAVPVEAQGTPLNSPV